MKATKIKLIKLTWYQKPIVDALYSKRYKYVVACLSRRIGKSILAKNFVVKYAIDNPNIVIGYITPSSDLARKFVKHICKTLKYTNLIAGSNLTDKYIEFSNGTVVYFMSAESRDNLRGNGFNLLIYDEAAYIPEDVYSYVLKAFELQAKKVLLISTPNGNTGFFAEAFKRGLSRSEKDKRYISFKTTLEESGLYDDDVVQDIKSSVTSLIYSQEYECEFLSENISAFGKVPYTSEIKPYKALYGGIDFGGNGDDETVLTLVDESGNMVFQKFYKEGDVKSLDDIADELIKRNVVSVCAESNSMGFVSIDYLSKKYPNLISVATTNDTKREYVEAVILMFEQGHGSVIDNEKNRTQFGNFVMKRTPSGKITYENNNPTVHDDVVISYCMAINAKNEGVGTYVLS